MKTTKGAGGETHQQTTDRDRTMTSAQGVPMSDDQNSLRAGARGPGLLEDQMMRDKIFHFDHERIPERVVHARGFGAKGYFELTDPIPDLSCADIFQRKGEKTDVFVRFSTVAGNKGSFDLARDTRGFAVKFYTKEGNWDLVGNNIPVFFIQDAIKFPDLIHSVKPAPDRGFPQAQSAHDNFWDFISLMPESMHHTMWAMSDRGIPRSFRTMEGFGVHTFRLVDAEGNWSFVKFHWKPRQGLQSVVWNEALKINGADPDYHRRDMWRAMTEGQPPIWDLGIQVFDQDFADRFDFDVLDATKIIPEEEVPVRIIGHMVLDTPVDNFFQETEQVAFCTQNIVRGLDFTEDPLLQGRNFSYLDTQTKRLGGPNFTHIPVNAPRCPMHHFQQDGHMAMHNPSGRANYEPNSWGEDGGPRENPEIGYRSARKDGTEAPVRLRAESFADHYSQPRQFYISQTEVEQMHIADAFTFELSKCEREDIRARVVSHLRNIDEGLAETVAGNLGLEMPEAAEPTVAPRDLKPSDPLSIFKNGPDSFAGRVLGLYVADGADQGLVEALQDAGEAEGAFVTVIAEKVGGATLSGGRELAGQETFAGGPSILYDAVAFVFPEDDGDRLAGLKPLADALSDAWAHGKVIGYTAGAKPLFDGVGLAEPDGPGAVALGSTDAQGFITECRALRHWNR